MLAAALQSNTSLRTLAIHAHSLDAVAGDEPDDEQVHPNPNPNPNPRASS